MKYSIVAAIYTIITFGASIYLLSFEIPKIALTIDTPFYLIHPVFSLGFFFSLSTVIVWFTVFLYSLYNIRSHASTLTETLRSHLLVIFLATITVVTSLSGSVFFYSTKVPRHEHKEFDDATLQSIPSTPNPFAAIHFLGMLFCEPAWIITVLSKYLGALIKRTFRLAFSHRNTELQ